MLDNNRILLFYIDLNLYEKYEKTKILLFPNTKLLEIIMILHSYNISNYINTQDSFSWFLD